MKAPPKDAHGRPTGGRHRMVDPIWVLTKGRCELGRRALFGAKTLKKFENN
jgi:hypothetical protein